MPDQPPILNQATAQKKFSCPSCVGEAQWNPDKQAKQVLRFGSLLRAGGRSILLP